ncbi:MAG: AraC family transcriptional regulator [Bacteroidota bacterium]
MDKKASTLINQQNGELAFKIFSFENDDPFGHIQRHNYYSIILIYAGTFELQIEHAKQEISAKVAICVSPYQPYSIKATGPIAGVTLHFHPDFFCTYKHQNEIQTEGVLFHNIFQPSFFSVPDEMPLLNLLTQMREEIDADQVGQHQQLVSYLKIFLLSMVRIKQGTIEDLPVATSNSDRMIRDLIYYIEKYYQHKHSTADYAQLLNTSTSALGKLVKKQFGRSLTNLLAERIVVEAKRELYLTSKTVKEIAFLFGYNDEYYFSRFFKKHAGISPTLYRNTVGFAKQES